MTENLTGDKALIRSLHICDDGCDWTSWHLWRMGERRRISEHVFTRLPVRQRAIQPSMKPKKKQCQKRKAKPTTDF